MEIGSRFFKWGRRLGTALLLNLLAFGAVSPASAQELPQNRSEPSVQFAWIPFLQTLYFQYVFLDPQSDLQNICQQFTSGQLEQLPPAPGVLAKSVLGDLSYLDFLIENFPDSLTGPGAPPPLLPGANLPFLGPPTTAIPTIFTQEQMRQHSFWAYPGLPGGQFQGGAPFAPHVLRGPAVTPAPVYFTPEQAREMSLQHYRGIVGGRFSNGAYAIPPLRRGVLCSPDATAIIWQTLSEYQDDRPAPPSPPSADSENINDGAGDHAGKISTPMDDAAVDIGDRGGFAQFPQDIIFFKPSLDAIVFPGDLPQSFEGLGPDKFALNTNECSAERDAVANARRDLAEARRRFLVGATFLREMVLAASNRLNEQQNLLNALYLEQADLSEMDETGSSADRISAALEQGRKDIVSAVARLRLLKAELLEAQNKYLGYGGAGSPQFTEIHDLEARLKAQLEALGACLDSIGGSDEVPPLATGKDDELPIPDLPVEEPGDPLPQTGGAVEDSAGTNDKGAGASGEGVPPGPSPKPPILLIPGHPDLVDQACLEQRNRVAQARKDLADAQQRYLMGLSFRRELVQIASNRLTEQQNLLTLLYQEQADLAQMDETGSSRERLASAIEQGLKDIATAVANLRKLDTELRQAKQNLQEYLRPGSRDREEIFNMDILLQLSMQRLGNCSRGAEESEIPEDLPPGAPAEAAVDLPLSDEISLLPEGQGLSEQDLNVENLAEQGNPPLDEGAVLPEITPAENGQGAMDDLLTPKVAYSATMNVDGAISKVYVDGDKTRYETSETLAGIFRQDRQIMWQIFADLGVYVESALPAKREPVIILQEVAGREVIGGYDTVKYHIVQEGAGGYQADGFYWITPEGIVVKTLASEVVNAQKRDISIELSDIKIGPIDLSLFERPDDLKLTTFPLVGGNN